ncbi:MAG: YARHG domain-containing protein [Cyanobacteria bacterium J06649_11]
MIGVSVIGSFWLLRPQNVISQSQIQDTVTRMTPEPQATIKSTENNFSWLSSRRVTDADLEGMNGYTLDVMRNYIFARHGRRFNNPGLQEYFDKQTWYTPKYLPQDFPSNLLSDLERDNVNYISMYQDKTNKRFFMK